MAATESSRLTRRTVLTGAAALLAAGAASPGSAAANGSDIDIRSATARGGQLLALTAEGEDEYVIRRFTVDRSRRVRLGQSLHIDFPAGFHPHSIAADHEGLWVSGAVDEFVKTLTVDNRLEALPERLRAWADPDDADSALPDGLVDIDIHRAAPGLLRIRGRTVEPVALPRPELLRSARAAAVRTLPGGALAVVIEGSPDPHLAVISRSHLAVSPDAGRNWREAPLAAGLGEGYGAVLAAAGSRLVAFAADAEGRQSVHTGGPDTEPRTVGTVPGAGRPMAAVAEAGRITLFSERDGAVREARFTAEGRAIEAAPECGCTGEVLAIAGLEGAWLEIDGADVSARGA